MGENAITVARNHEALQTLPAPMPLSLAASFTVADMKDMAVAIVQGGLFPQFKTPQQAFSLMLLCQAKNLHPMQAIERYDIVQGRPAMKAAAMHAAFIEAGGRVEFHRSDDECCDATFSHPAGGTLRVTWDMVRANNAGLTNKDTWRKHPAQMLRARCISEGVRAIAPGVVLGIYTPEETQDFEPSHPQQSNHDSPAPAPSGRPAPPPPSPNGGSRPASERVGVKPGAFDGGATGKTYSRVDKDPVTEDRQEALEAHRAMVGAIDAFRQEAMRLGLDRLIVNDAGKPSKGKMAELLANVFGEDAMPDMNNLTPADWAKGTELLAPYVEQIRAREAAEKKRKERPTLNDGDFDPSEWDDPFAEENLPDGPSSVSQSQTTNALAGGL